jgi:hypothetical protein
MIVHSDNPSSDMLVDFLSQNLSREELELLSRENDLIAPLRGYQSGEIVVTARSYSGYFRVLYNATYLGREMSEVGLGLLARSSFDLGIARGVPDGVVVANKYGFGGDPRDPLDFQFHDCGIVYSDRSPYILCIFTKSTGDRAAQEVISAISTEVYGHLHPAEEPRIPVPSRVRAQPLPKDSQSIDPPPAAIPTPGFREW